MDVTNKLSKSVLNASGLRILVYKVLFIGTHVRFKLLILRYLTFFGFHRVLHERDSIKRDKDYGMGKRDIWAKYRLHNLCHGRFGLQTVVVAMLRKVPVTS